MDNNLEEQKLETMPDGEHNKILKLGMQDKVVELRSYGKSYKEIADEISKLTGQKISYGAVFRHLTEYKESRDALLKKKEGLLNATIKQEISVIDDLITLKTKLSNYLDRALAEDSRIVPSAANALTKQLEIIAKILGDLKTTHEHKNINVDMHMVAPKIGEVLNNYKRAGKLYCKRCKSRDIAFDPEEPIYQELENEN